jgi:phage terminase Nu1 subunit (DNA packaging protein)
MNIEPTTTVNDATLAALLGMSTRRVRQLVESGDLTRTGRNEFQLGAALRELLDHAAGEGANGALIRERVRATKAAADLREIEVAKARGEVARVEDFERVQGHTAMLVRTNMLNIPGRAVVRLIGETDEARFKQALRDEIVLALRAAYDAIKRRTIEVAVTYEPEAPEHAQ